MRERLGEEARASLVTEARRLNLSKYAEEVALGVAEAKLKSNDIYAALELATAMHTGYAAFAPALQPALVRNATLPAPNWW